MEGSKLIRWKNGKVREAGEVRTEEEKARFFI